MSLSPIISLPLAIAIVYLLSSLFHRRKSIKFLHGPPSSRWLLGHEYELAQHPHRAISWSRHYGSVFRTVGSCGQQVLMVSDEEALYHILNTGRYRYPKTQEEQKLIEQRCGRGLSWVQGELAMHQRHKKALSHVFSESQLENFLPMFQMYANKLALRWQEGVANSQAIDVSAWSSKVVLDILGESSFDFDFKSLDDKSSMLRNSLQKISADPSRPSKATIMVRGMKRILPRPMVRLFKNVYIPEEEVWSRVYEDTAKSTARDVLRNNGLTLGITSEKSLRDSQRQSYLKQTEGKKDMLNMLLRLKAAQNPNRELLVDDDEVLSQISTMLLAGYQATASTLTWILHELSRHPKDQQTLWTEIDAIRTKRGHATMFTLNDYESMPYLNACIKEALRLHPAADFITREADLDDVVPLAHPVASTSGEMLKKIPVMKGQRIQIAIGAYNRSPSIWGHDSDTWNPSRHMVESKECCSALGVFGNLMSFGSGVRACIGWRFAVIELQAILVCLLSQFDFQIPSEAKDASCNSSNAFENKVSSEKRLIVKRRVL
ncbi:hypothetical protein GYMLUDRAFT_35941 [Collybiopsis luxurians FD-317 M1]|nr:hypothetical protein GYMLUDRAFT_35941 [Collybiopsis luxurians FD-317 M1]